MDLGFLKNFALAIVFTAVLIVAVNVIGDLAVDGNSAVDTVAPKKTETITPDTQPTQVMTKTGGDLSALLASADLGAGKKSIRRCKGCHTFDKGGRNLAGPNLWNLLGRQKGSIEGYRYSKALAGLGGNWSYGDLDQFLTNPRSYAKGTKMIFKGLRKATDRAAIITYLRGLSDSPLPLP